MTTQEMISKLKGQISAMEAITGSAIATVHAVQVKRIFTDGENAEGGEIGQYNSTKPLYVNPANSPRKFGANVGKNKKSKFKNGNSHKSRYFASYKDFREKIGRQTAKVDLRLTNRLQIDYSNSLTQTSEGVWVVGTQQEENSKKLEGIIDKYGEDIFKVSPAEHQLLVTTVEKEINAILSR